jgi:hypothetical protein
MAKRVAATVVKRAAAVPKKAVRKTTKKIARKSPAQWTDESRELFLSVLADTANVAKAARAADMSRTAAYAERKRNADFAQSWQMAMDIALDELELSVVTRATFGYDKEVYYSGEMCGTVRHYSDALAMFLLRAHRPDVYGKASPDGGVPTSTPDDMRAMIESKLSGLQSSDAEADTDV